MPNQDRSMPDDVRSVYEKLTREAIKDDLQEFLSEDDEVSLDQVIREIKDMVRVKEGGGDAA